MEESIIFKHMMDHDKKNEIKSYPYQKDTYLIDRHSMPLPIIYIKILKKIFFPFFFKMGPNNYSIP